MSRNWDKVQRNREDNLSFREKADEALDEKESVTFFLEMDRKKKGTRIGMWRFLLKKLKKAEEGRTEECLWGTRKPLRQTVQTPGVILNEGQR